MYTDINTPYIPTHAAVLAAVLAANLFEKNLNHYSYFLLYVHDIQCKHRMRPLDVT